MSKHKRQSFRTLTPNQEVSPVSTPDVTPVVDADKELSEASASFVEKLATGQESASAGLPEAPNKLGDDAWLLENLKDAGEPQDKDFFNQWVASEASTALTPEQVLAISQLPVDTDYSASDVVAKIKEATAILKEPDDEASDVGQSVESTADTGDSEEALTFDYEEFRITNVIPDRWTDDNIDQWISVAGYNTPRTANGSFVNDPTRKDRPISTWATGEIVDAIRGELDGIEVGQHGELANAYRQLETVDAAWSARDLLDWLQQGLEPAKTSNGAWRNDVTRARRLARDWTTQELVAWAIGEIRPVGETTDVKVAAELNRRLDLGVLTNDPNDVIKAYKRTQAGTAKIVGVQPTAATPTTLQPEPAVEPEVTLLGLTKLNAAYLATQTSRYLKMCAPGVPITPEIGVKEQRQLDNMFRYILKLEDPVGFGSAMTFLRDFYKKHRDGLFEPTYASRFTGLLRTDGYLQETHVNLLAILNVYTNPDKSARKQLDLAFLLRNFPVDKQAWLIEFFQKYC